MNDEDTVLVDETHCLEEILDASACCDAKQEGKAGTGLEDACATVSFMSTDDENTGECVNTNIDGFGDLIFDNEGDGCDWYVNNPTGCN